MSPCGCLQLFSQSTLNTYPFLNIVLSSCVFSGTKFWERCMSSSCILSFSLTEYILFVLLWISEHIHYFTNQLLMVNGLILYVLSHSRFWWFKKRVGFSVELVYGSSPQESLMRYVPLVSSPSQLFRKKKKTSAVIFQHFYRDILFVGWRYMWCGSKRSKRRDWSKYQMWSNFLFVQIREIHVKW